MGQIGPSLPEHMRMLPFSEPALVCPRCDGTGTEPEPQ